MSMTQITFLKKADIPSPKEIQTRIQEHGYSFEFHTTAKKLYDLDGIYCTVNGRKTFIAIHTNIPEDITKDCAWIKPDLTDQDIAISFTTVNDSIANTCLGLISTTIIDRSNALVYYRDAEISYNNQNISGNSDSLLTSSEPVTTALHKEPKPITILTKIKEFF